FAVCARVLGPNCGLAGREAKVSNNRFGGYLRVCVSLLLVFLFPLHGYGQNNAAGTNPASPADSQQVAASALQELEAMKHRIEVLEAEIRRLKGQQNSQTAADSDPAAAAPLAGNAVVAGGTATAGQEPAPAANPAKAEPFSFADFTWLNGTPRTKEVPLDTKFFTPEIRVDADYIYDFAHPKDDTIGGSSEVFRTNEVQLTQLGVGGDFHFDNVRARVMTQFGMYSVTTPRNDASPARGQWDLDGAYRYVSEAYGGYHFNVLH